MNDPKLRMSIVEWAATISTLAILAGVISLALGVPVEICAVMWISGFIGMFAFGNLWWKVAEDDTLRVEARDGISILLTYEQYLSMNAANPDKYPLTETVVDKMGQWGERRDGSHVKMLSKDRNRLRQFIQEQEAVMQADRAHKATIAELQEMRDTLSGFIAEQEKKNLETATVAKAQTIRLVAAETAIAESQGQKAVVPSQIYGKS